MNRPMKKNKFRHQKGYDVYIIHMGAPLVTINNV